MEWSPTELLSNYHNIQYFGGLIFLLTLGLRKELEAPKKLSLKKGDNKIGQQKRIGNIHKIEGIQRFWFTSTHTHTHTHTQGIL